MGSGCPEGTDAFRLRLPSLSECLGAILLYGPLGVALAILTPRGGGGMVEFDPAWGLLLAAAVVAVHEGTHALAYALLTRRIPRVGAKSYCVYVSMEGVPVGRRSFTAVALSTLVGLSAVLLILKALAGEWPWGVMYLMNLVGSSGDFVLAVESAAFPPNSTVLDAGDSALVCVKQGWRSPGWLRHFRRFLRRAAAALPPVLAVSVLAGLRVRVEGRGLFEETVWIEVDPLAVAAGYAVGIVLALALTRRGEREALPRSG